MRFFPNLVDEKIRASHEVLHAQISALTEMMDHLIHSNCNSAKETTTVSSRGARHQYESPYNEIPGSFRFPTVAPFTAEGHSPDTWSLQPYQDPLNIMARSWKKCHDKLHLVAPVV